MFSWGKQQQNNVDSRPPPPPPPPSSSYSNGGQNSSSVVSNFLRNDHIQSYVGDATLGPSTRRVSRDDTTYDTVFQTRNGDALILRVHFPLPTTSSQELPPVMTLVGVRATHPWLDHVMRISGYPQLNSPENWARSNLKLGAAVNAVVRHLQLEPPKVIQITDISLQRLQDSLQQNQPKPNNSVVSSTHSQASTSMQPESASPPPDYDAISFHIPIPPVPTSFPELENLTSAELHNLRDNEEAFDSLAQSMSSVATLKDLMQSIFKGNVETAHSHLDQNQEQLETLHAEVSALHSELQGKVLNFQNLEKQLPKSDTDDNVKLIRKLTTAKKEALNESEKIASRWVNDNEAEHSLDDFVEEFIHKRSVHHLRAAKVERLQHLKR